MRVEIVATLLLSGLTLGGCLGNDGANVGQSTTDPGTAPTGTFSETTGAIRGFVTDLELSPIVGALVGLQGTELETRTAADGSYQFSELEPGPYTVLAARFGYEPGQQSVTVAAGELTRNIDFRLEPIPVTDPRLKTEIFDGLITCSVGTAGLISEECGTGLGTPVGTFGGNPNNKIDWNFNITNDVYEDLNAVFIELDWEPQTAAAQQLGLHVAHGFVCTPGCDDDRKYCDVFANYGPPVQTCTVAADNLGIGEIEDGDELEWSMTARAWAAPSGLTEAPNIVLEQKFTMYRTYFWDMDVPEGFTAVPS